MWPQLPYFFLITALYIFFFFFHDRDILCFPGWLQIPGLEGSSCFKELGPQVMSRLSVIVYCILNHSWTFRLLSVAVSFKGTGICCYNI